MNNCGLGSGNYLLINYDEKWLWGMVMRRSAKACVAIGLGPVSYKVYHSIHINRVIHVTVTRIAFIDSLDNRGEALKLGNYRSQSCNIPQRKLYETERQAYGSIRRVTKTEMLPDGSKQ